jgi:hypothetical protein
VDDIVPVVDVVTVSVDIVPLVAVFIVSVLIVELVPVAAVSVELAPVVLTAVSVAAVSVLTFCSFLQPTAKIATASAAASVRTRDFFITISNGN